MHRDQSSPEGRAEQECSHLSQAVLPSLQAPRGSPSAGGPQRGAPSTQEHSLTHEVGEELVTDEPIHFLELVQVPTALLCAQVPHAHCCQRLHASRLLHQGHTISMAMVAAQEKRPPRAAQTLREGPGRAEGLSTGQRHCRYTPCRQEGQYLASPTH